MAKILVVTESLDRFKRSNFFLHLLIEQWQKTGFGVQIREGIDRLPEADVAILHASPTRLSKSYQDLSLSYPTVLNINALDISKRRISRQLLTPDGDYKGPVIVKTDDNCGGVADRHMRYSKSLLGRLHQAIDRKRHWSHSGIIKTKQYPIYQSMLEVPPAVWRNPLLVVERFIAERHSESYALRQWVFLGGNEISQIAFSKNPIVKAGNITHSEPLESVPNSLRVLRKELGFDYGKFDYVVHDGQAVLLDANRTPTARVRNPEDKAYKYAAVLAEGIRSYLP